VSLLLAMLLAGAPADYAKEARVAYLREALAAVEAADPEVLSAAVDYVSAMERNACTSEIDRLRVDCLITSARRWCRTKQGAKDRACPMYSDIAVTNVLSEKHLISAEERYEIMRRSKNFREEMRRVVRRQHGALALDFSLASRTCAPSDGACLAAKIDDYCAAAADVKNLSWQSCTAALVWFIGTNRGGPGG
jgi:hypothetical protein